VAYWQGDYARATALYEESLALFRELGNKWFVASSTCNLGLVAEEQGDAARATALSRELGHKWWIAFSLTGLGHVASVQGDYARATALCEEGLALSREYGDRWLITLSLTGLGHAASLGGDTARGTALYGESLAVSREMGDKRGIAASLEGLARTATAPLVPTEVCAWGTQLLGAAAALRAAIGAPVQKSEQGTYEHAVAALRAVLGEAPFEAAWAAGQAMTLEQVLALTLDAPPA
jgi:tetratricopeptide (TPR) repeat protein